MLSLLKILAMIQRIQTVFLALVAALGVVFSFVPVLGFNVTNGGGFIMNAYKSINVETGEVIAKNMGVGVLQGVVILLCIVIILMFKNRALQMKLAKFNILLIAVQIAAIVMYSDTAKTAIGVNPEIITVAYKFGCVIPLVSLILTYLSIRFIKKDDELVRSADRLR